MSSLEIISNGLDPPWPHILIVNRIQIVCANAHGIVPTTHRDQVVNKKIVALGVSLWVLPLELTNST